MWFYIVLCVLLVLFAILFVVFVINKNKYQVLLIKINESEKNINELLNKKYNLLLEIGKAISSKTNEEAFDNLENIIIDNLNSFELNAELAKFDNIVMEYSDFNKDIVFDDEELKLFDEISAVNIECLASERYFNDNSRIFNKLLTKFPSSFVGKLKRYKEKEFYLNKKEEIFEILKK